MNEEYQNLISLLRKALEFYANSNNYSGATGTAAMISLDDYGSQARFAIVKINEFEKNHKDLEAEYMKTMTEAIQTEKSVAGIQKVIEEFKKLNDDGNKNV